MPLPGQACWHPDLSLQCDQGAEQLCEDPQPEGEARHQARRSSAQAAAGA